MKQRTLTQLTFAAIIAGGLALGSLGGCTNEQASETGKGMLDAAKQKAAAAADKTSQAVDTAKQAASETAEAAKNAAASATQAASQTVEQAVDAAKPHLDTAAEVAKQAAKDMAAAAVDH